MNAHAMSTYTIAPADRGWAVVAHLSGFGSMVIPLGGILVPVILLLTKGSENATIGAIARQALFLNIAATICYVTAFFLVITIILIPVSIVLAAGAGLMQLILPIIGAVKAGNGEYYRYPIVGHDPS